MYLSCSKLMHHYQLTVREAAIASKLCEGLSIEEIAAQDGVKPATVRSQLKSIFHKTATARQGELIVSLLKGPAATDD